MAVGQDMHYYDFLLVGKTGMGKSTLGNKLLQVETVDPTKIRLFSSGSFSSGLFTHPIRAGSQSPIVRVFKKVLPGKSGADASEIRVRSGSKATPDDRRFPTADDYPPDDEKKALPVTKECKLLANDDTKVRVLDAPGFFDSDTLSVAAKTNVSIREGNLQTIRWFVRIQESMNLQVRRVVYFLPIRGYLEKADAVLQEELQVMHHFFGAAIFSCMVVIATSQAKKELSTEEMKKTERVFCTALKFAIPDEAIACPPIIYIGINDTTDVLAKLKGAPVKKEEILKLEFVDNVCARCSVNFRSLGQEKLEIVDSNGTLIPYEETKCHPVFVRKYHTGQKIAGGFAHVVTFGIVYVASLIRGRTIWPGFTNSDEICPTCGCSPGSPGCSKVKERIKVKFPSPKENMLIEVNHTNKL